MTDAYQPGRKPAKISLVEFLLNRARGNTRPNLAVQPNPGADPRAIAQVQNQADSVPYFAGGAMGDPFIGQNGPIRPGNPFNPNESPYGRVMGPATVTEAPSPPRVAYNPPGGMPSNPQLEALLASAFPGSGVPADPARAGPAVNAPVPDSQSQIMAEMQQLDPNAFGSGGPPPIQAFEDVPIGDTLIVENPWPVTPPQGGQGGPPPIGDVITGQNPWPITPRVAPPTSAVPMPAPVPPRPAADPFAAAGGAAPVAPRPFIPAPSPAAGPPVRRPGLLRSAGPQAVAMTPMPTPQADPLKAMLAGQDFLAQAPKPPVPAPTPAAAPTKPGPVDPPAMAGGPKLPPVAPVQGAQMPEHLKEQLLAEAVRLTAKKRGTMPAGAP